MVFYVSSTYAESPCWFSNPVSEEYIGFIGSASSISVMPNDSLLSSRKKALKRFFEYYQIDIRPLEEKSLLKNELDIEGWSIRFSEPYITEGSLFSYALVSQLKSNIYNKAAEKWLTQSCTNQLCDFQRCSPQWLCNSAGNHIFGVSQMTSMPSKQLPLMHKNAALFDAFLRESNVKNTSHVVESTGQSHSWRFREQISKVDASSENLLKPLLNTHICKSESYVVGLFERSESTSFAKKKFVDWKINPNLKGRVGVTGTFDGLTADGLLSTAVKLAIKNGLIELAKIKNVSIDHEHQLSYTNGWYSLTKSTESTFATVSAVLMDLKVVEEDEKLVMFVWLLDI